MRNSGDVFESRPTYVRRLIVAFYTIVPGAVLLTYPTYRQIILGEGHGLLAVALSLVCGLCLVSAGLWYCTQSFRCGVGKVSKQTMFRSTTLPLDSVSEVRMRVTDIRILGLIRVWIFLEVFFDHHDSNVGKLAWTTSGFRRPIRDAEALAALLRRNAVSISDANAAIHASCLQQREPLAESFGRCGRLPVVSPS